MISNQVMGTAHYVSTTKGYLCDNNTIMYELLIITLLTKDITQSINYYMIPIRR